MLEMEEKKKGRQVSVVKEASAQRAQIVVRICKNLALQHEIELGDERVISRIGLLRFPVAAGM